MRSVDRRDFLRYLAFFTAAAVIPRSSNSHEFFYNGNFPPIPESIDLKTLTPNSNANLVNAVVVPENLLARTNREALRMSIDFQSTYNSSKPDNLRNNIWGYGESVKDAIRRGQVVWLILDIPDNTTQVSLPDLARYFTAVVKEYSLTTGTNAKQVAKFVVGNELNALPQTRVHDYLRWYAQVFLQAIQSMRQVMPTVMVYPFADAYYGSGETLDLALKFIFEASPSIRIPGLCFHYYDAKSGIRERSQIYSSLASQYGIPNQLHLLELGKSEATISVDLHQEVIVRNLAETLALVNEGILQTMFWHTAERVGNPNGHALFLYDQTNRLVAQEQFFTFNKVRKLLHHSVSWEEQSLDAGYYRVRVTGLTSNEDRVLITWMRVKHANGQIVSDSKPELSIESSGKLNVQKILSELFMGLR